MTHRENLLRCIRFETPEYIPMTFHINDACWHHYDQEALKDLMESHPRLFPGYRRPPGTLSPAYLPNAVAARPYTDPWGCVWLTSDDGTTGAVHGHPLETWDGFERYRAPDQLTTDGTYPLDWEKVGARVRKARASGELVWAGLPHGHTFLRILDIRGYENTLMDMVEDHPNLKRLIGMVAEFNLRYVMKWMELQPDIFGYPEDLGMQTGPMISPALFRKFIKPVYRRLMQPARDAECIVQMHSDGDIRALADDLLDAGVHLLNLQDLVNGIDWIAERFAGRTSIELDIDRQSITRFGSPSQIDGLIRNEVEKLSTPRGGLMMVFGMYPGIPIENARVLMDAMERYMDFHS